MKIDLPRPRLRIKAAFQETSGSIIDLTPLHGRGVKYYQSKVYN